MLKPVATASLTGHLGFKETPKVGELVCMTFDGLSSGCGTDRFSIRVSASLGSRLRLPLSQTAVAHGKSLNESAPLVPLTCLLPHCRSLMFRPSDCLITGRASGKYINLEPMGYLNIAACLLHTTALSAATSQHLTTGYSKAPTVGYTPKMRYKWREGIKLYRLVRRGTRSEVPMALAK
jgi:hypothetical protein